MVQHSRAIRESSSTRNRPSPESPSLPCWNGPSEGATADGFPLNITRTELALILAITVAGCAARFAKLSEVAVEHFDEGVYASNLWFSNEGYAYPDRHLYAPPFVPALIEWSMILWGGPTAPLLPGVVLGSLTVPLLWWVTRCWFGAAAGVAAASLLALNDFHITMSRSALTDVPMVFFLLLAVWLIHLATSQARPGIAALGGLATALAWSTKYNGWLPLAIAISGTTGALAASRLSGGMKRVSSSNSNRRTPASGEADPPSTRDLLLVLGIAVLVAGAGWSPVLSDLPNGYSEVSSNHRQYVGDLSEWIPSAIRHEAIGRHYAGLGTWLSGLLAAVSAALVLRAERSTWNSSDNRSLSSIPTWQLVQSARGSSSTWNAEPGASTIAATCALTGAIVLSPLIVLLVWSLVGLVTLIARTLRVSSSSDFSGHNACAYRLALWFGLAWLSGLLLATPIYRPYPRLILPLQCVATMGTGAAIVMLLAGSFLNAGATSSKEGISRNQTARLAWLVPVALLCAWRGLSTGVPAWQPRTELADIARDATRVAAANCQGEASEVEGFDYVVYVYGEPGLLHHIPSSHDRAFVKAVMDLSFTGPGYDHARIPAFVLAGPHALDSLEFLKQVAEAGPALEEIGVFPYRPSDFVLLDEVPPGKLDASRARLVRLYRVRFP